MLNQISASELTLYYYFNEVSITFTVYNTDLAICLLHLVRFRTVCKI